MLKISKLADYATVIMNFLAIRPEQVFSAAEIARQIQVAVPTVSKVLKLLSEAGLLISARGASGGYQLSKSAAEISLIEVITAIDGSPAITECSQKHKICSQESVCAVRHNWRLINQVIMSALRGLSLADMTKPLTTKDFVAQGLVISKASQKFVEQHS